MNQSDISTALKAATKLSGSGAAQTYIPGRTDFQDNHINFSSKGMSIQHKSGYVSPYNGAEVTSSNFHQVRNESIEGNSLKLVQKYLACLKILCFKCSKIYFIVLIQITVAK